MAKCGRLNVWKRLKDLKRFSGWLSFAWYCSWGSGPGSRWYAHIFQSFISLSADVDKTEAWVNTAGSDCDLPLGIYERSGYTRAERIRLTWQPRDTEWGKQPSGAHWNMWAAELLWHRRSRPQHNATGHSIHLQITFTSEMTNNNIIPMRSRGLCVSRKWKNHGILGWRRWFWFSNGEGLSRLGTLNGSEEKNCIVHETSREL